MSISSYRNTIDRLRTEIARLDKQANQELAKAAGYEQDIARIHRSITANTSTSTLRSKSQQIESKRRSLIQAQKQASNYQSQSAQKHKALSQQLENLRRAEEQQQQRQNQEDKRRRQEEIRHSQQLTRDLETRAKLNRELSKSHYVIDLAALPQKINVLFMAANPLDQSQLRLDEEIREIAKEIRAADHRDSVDLRQAWAARPEDILQALNEHKPRVVHFSGHGTSAGELVFQDDSGGTKLISINAIAATLATLADNIQLVVFNSCFSEAQAQAVTQHVDFAIGMNDTIRDDAARVFAGQLYSSIGFGLSIQTSFDQARAKLMLTGIPEDQIPQLYWREGLDPQNVSLVRPEAALPEPSQALG